MAAEVAAEVAAEMYPRWVVDACAPKARLHLQMIEDAMIDMSLWLDDHPKNVVAVHCKAGKGRTGIIVCCFLFWRRYFPTMEQVGSVLHHT